MFIDTARIKITSGRGGDGKVSFHREKYISAGGPDGGDGGKGGSVYFVVDDHMSTLLDFKYKRKFQAENGMPGGNKNMSGKNGADLYIKVPRGTLIRSEDGALIKDMSGSEPFLAAPGGRGGYGNARFASPTRQAPRFAKPGFEGAELNLTLELKLIADVGLVGMPNAGKSTLLSVISAARPKIADYPFTTLEPNLGVVYAGEGASFVCADIPGLIEGASQGAGLGHGFLRHVERCRMLIHVVDAAGTEGRDPVEDLITINNELSSFSDHLAGLPQIIAANKLDAMMSDSDYMRALRKKAAELNVPILEISAATNQGVKPLVDAVWQMLEGLPPVTVYEPEKVLEFFKPYGEREIEINHEGDVWYVTGSFAERLVAQVNFGDYESRMYFDRVLRNAGVYDMLEKAGIKEKETVDVCGMQFEYII